MCMRGIPGVGEAVAAGVAPGERVAVYERRRWAVEAQGQALPGSGRP